MGTRSESPRPDLAPSAASTFSKTHIQRSGLLLANCGTGCNKNYVYIAFSMMDGAGYPFPNGAIFGYDAMTLSSTTMFSLQTSQGRIGTSNGGGIWMGAAGPAYGTDVNGKNWISLTTANGTFDLNTTGGTNAGDSFLKLNPNGLAIDVPSGGPGYFTPVDQFFRSKQPDSLHMKCDGDKDLGSGGVMLVPDGELQNWPHLAVSGDKEGGLWFGDRTQPGGYDTACGDNCSCNPTVSGNNIQTYWTGSPYGGPPIHTSPAFWGV